MAGCDSIIPPDFEIEHSHQVACHLFNPDPPFNSSAVKIEAFQQRKDSLFSNLFSGARCSDSLPLVQVKDLRVYFPILNGMLKRKVGYVHAVDDVAFTVERGKTLALVGESGCGKTTLGKAILRLGVPVTGKVVYEDVNLVDLKRTALQPYRKRLQIMFQDPHSSLNPRMMVGDIIQEGMQVHGIGVNARERKHRVNSLMQQVGLSPDMADRYPHEFSGGQRQRIGIARCLAVEPEFIICDEVTSALDVSVQAQILNLLKELQVKFNLSYLFITHDLSVVEYLADELAVMYLGRIVERGTMEEIFENPKHPYTRRLLSAVPKIDPETVVQKIRLDGDVPSPVNPPRGCHFHPRCSEAMSHCHEAYPPEVTFTKTHACRCYLYDV